MVEVIKSKLSCRSVVGSSAWLGFICQRKANRSYRRCRREYRAQAKRALWHLDMLLYRDDSASRKHHPACMGGCGVEGAFMYQLRIGFAREQLSDLRQHFFTVVWTDGVKRLAIGKDETMSRL